MKNSTTTSLSISSFSSKPIHTPQFKIFTLEFSPSFFRMLLKVIDDSRWHKLSEPLAVHRVFKTIFKLWKSMVHFAPPCSELERMSWTRWKSKQNPCGLPTESTSLLRWIYFLRKRIFYCCVCGWQLAAFRKNLSVDAAGRCIPFRMEKQQAKDV